MQDTSSIGMRLYGRKTSQMPEFEAESKDCDRLHGPVVVGEDAAIQDQVCRSTRRQGR